MDDSIPFAIRIVTSFDSFEQSENGLKLALTVSLQMISLMLHDSDSCLFGANCARSAVKYDD